MLAILNEFDGLNLTFSVIYGKISHANAESGLSNTLFTFLAPNMPVSTPQYPPAATVIAIWAEHGW